MVAIEIGNEVLEAAGLLAEVSGGANQFGQLILGQGAQRGEIESAGAAKTRNGALDIFPGSILRKQGADDDFEAGACRPPVLRAIVAFEGEVMGADERVSGFEFLVFRNAALLTERKNKCTSLRIGSLEPAEDWLARCWRTECRRCKSHRDRCRDGSYTASEDWR